LSGGEKMSKTKGTGVDPLQMTQQYGTDALRFMLVSMAAPGTDIILSEDRILSARAFANKIWNAARFLFFNLEKIEAQGVSIEELASPQIRAQAPYSHPDGSFAVIDLWFFSRLSTVIREFNTALESFRFHEACQTIYQFFWGDFCDWYIEWVKPELTSADKQTAISAWRNIFAALDAALRLLHPVMPFVTEELWHRLPQPAGARSIALDKFPVLGPKWIETKGAQEMKLFQEIIVAARNIRAEMKLDQKRKVPAELSIGNPLARKLVQENLDPVLRLANLSELVISSDQLNPEGGAMRSTALFDLRIAYGDAVDTQVEIARLKKDLERLAKDIDSKQARLADEEFTSKAPAKIVQDLRSTLVERQLEHKKLLDRLKQLES
jgi:valyl-tRNA synthetase